MSLSQTKLPRVASFALDVLISTSSFVLAYAFAVGLERLAFVPSIEEKTVAFAAISGFALWVFSVHRGSWRYVSIPDLLSLIKASILAVGIYTVAAFLVSRGDNVPRSVPVLTGLFMLAGTAGMRLAYRLLMDGNWLAGLGNRVRTDSRRVLLYGFNQGAETFIRAARRGAAGPISIAGIVDDSPINHSRSLQGVQVYGSLEELDSIVKRLNRRGAIEELVVTEHMPGRRKLSAVLEAATAAGLKVSRIPDATERASVTNDFILKPKPIELGDLLGRPEVKTDLEGVAHLISGKVILATGAGGSIGSELCRQIAQFDPKQLIITDSSEYLIYLLDAELRSQHPTLPIVTRMVNVRDQARVSQICGELRPDVIFHAAALKHVPLVEENPLEAIKTNLLGTRNIANAAIANGVSSFVMISTDKAVNPTSIMGATKRAAESYCQALDVVSEKTRFKTVRFGNVLGSNGSVVPRFHEQIAKGGPVTVTHPQIVRYFMTIPEAVRLVLHASGQALRRQDERGKIMVLDMGKPVRIVDLAERMIQLAGLKPHHDIEIVFTGLRPGEKLYEELFDSEEIFDGKTDEGYVVASPRIVDSALLHRTLTGLEDAIGREDVMRAMTLLAHLVPEYRKRPLEEMQDHESLGNEAEARSIAGDLA